MTAHARSAAPRQARDPRDAGRVSLAGEIVREYRVLGTDPELGAVVRVRLHDRSEVVLSGVDLPRRQVGARIAAAGYWDVNAHGPVFRVTRVERFEHPQTTSAVVAYLATNIPGLGKQRAKRLSAAHAGRTLAYLAEHPEYAEAVFPGGTGVAIAMALRQWAAEQQRDAVAQRLTQRLTAAGVGYGLVRRILRYFSSTDAAAVVALRHPYRLLDVPGIGWAQADEIAQRLGVASSDAVRLDAACSFVLRDAPSQGHSALPVRHVAARAATLLQRERGDEAIAAAADRLMERGEAVEVEGRLGLPRLVQLEAEIADRLVGVQLAERAFDAPHEAAVAPVLAAATISTTQRAAVEEALRCGVSVLTGRPGAGKTTTIKTLVACAKALDWQVRVVAPTGKAASRAGAQAGVPASTVHRLLARTPMDAPPPLAVDLLVVDEASMLDLETAAWLLRAVESARGTRVVWCGDADQLPSVGPGQVLADLVAAGVLPTTRLVEVFRQASGSPIIANAHRLLDGTPMALEDQPGWSTRMLESVDGERAVRQAVHDALTAGYRPEEIQVLAPMRRGALGVESLNRMLQQLLNPTGAPGPVVGGGQRARVGDRLVVTRNLYELETPVFNGEQGVVVGASARGQMDVQFGDRLVRLEGVQCMMTRLAWAMTVHRSQGSEYPAVVFAYDHRAHHAMLDRRLLYTGITRAKSHLTLLTTSEAVRLTYERQQRLVRYTTLQHHLRSLLARGT